MLPPKELEYVGKQLKKIKCKTLDEYYQTKQWEIVKRVMRDQPDITCHLCDDRESKDVKMNLHHKTYKRLGEELGYDLLWLCESCHTSFHETVNSLLGDGENMFSYVLDSMRIEQILSKKDGN